MAEEETPANEQESLGKAAEEGAEGRTYREVAAQRLSLDDEVEQVELMTFYGDDDQESEATEKRNPDTTEPA